MVIRRYYQWGLLSRVLGAELLRQRGGASPIHRRIQLAEDAARGAKLIRGIGLDKFDAAMDSQAKAFLVAVRAAAEQMGKGGRIVAITYTPGGRYGSWQSWVAMGAAKSALKVLCRYFAVALAPRGITVNAISPGWVEDTVLNTLPDAVVQMIREWHKGGWTPMGRIGTTADLGDAVSLLCTEEAGWITGQVIAADGGASLMDPGLPLAIQQPAAVAQPA